MKKRNIVALLIAFTMALSVASCSKDEPQESSEAPVETTAAVAETTVADETVAFPTGIPLNQAEYVEFESPIAYNVIHDADAYTDNSVQTYARTYYEGSMVIGVATDGYYVILDDGSVVVASNLEAMQ